VPALSNASLFSALGVEEGGVNVYKPEGLKNYHISFRHHGRQVFRSCGTTEFSAAKARGAEIFVEEVNKPKKEAEQAKLDTIIKRLDSLALPGLPPSPVTEIHLDDALREYLEFKKGLSKDHVVRMDRRLRAFNKWAANSAYALGDLNAKVIRAWLDSLKRKTADSEAKELAEVSTFLKWCAASDRGWISANPCDGLTRRPQPRATGEPIEVCDVSDVIALFE